MVSQVIEENGAFLAEGRKKEENRKTDGKADIFWMSHEPGLVRQRSYFWTAGVIIRYERGD